MILLSPEPAARTRWGVHLSLRRYARAHISHHVGQTQVIYAIRRAQMPLGLTGRSSESSVFSMLQTEVHFSSHPVILSLFMHANV